MASEKEIKSTAGPSGTIIDWAIRFSFVGHSKTRWGFGPQLPIRNVTLRLSESTGSSEDGLREVWRVDGIDTRSCAIQPVLDTLDVAKNYALELSLLQGDMYRSSGPAGPHTGRSNFEELPPLKGTEKFDYQLRPIRFWLVLEDVPAGAAGRKRIREIWSEPRDRQPRPPAGLATLVAADELRINHVQIDWRPDWLRRVRAEKPGSKQLVTCIVPGKYKIRDGTPTHIVLHNTGGYTNDPPVRIGPSLDKFTSDWNSKNEPSHHGIHYLIDYDGHVLKMCPEHRGMGHADTSHWRGTEGLNRCSIGIEHVHHKLDTEFPRAQRRASLDLVEQLQAAFGIEGRNIVGHGEVMIIEDAEFGEILGRDKLVSCPGPQFYWPSFIRRGIIPDHEAVELGDWETTAYSGYFARSSAGKPSTNKLQEGDSDGPRRWGGKAHGSDAPYTGIIRELHEDMRTIGYFVASGKHNSDDAVFTTHLSRALKAFKARYLAPSSINANKIDERVNHEFAKLIKQVAVVSKGAAP